VKVEVCIGNVVYCENVFGYFEVNVMNLVFAMLDIVIAFAGNAVFAEFNLVGEHECCVDNVVDFLAATVLVDGVTNDADVRIAEWAIIAIIGLQETACDACAVAGVIIFSADHATIVKHAGDFRKNHVMITTASAASKILGDSSDIKPVFDTVVAAELYIFIRSVGSYGLCPDAPLCIVVYAVMELLKKNHTYSSILNLPF